MRRNRPTADDSPGQDSFLDVVANMVGILIILVTVVGVRAGQAPVDAPSPEPLEPADPQARAQLAAARSAATSLEAEVHAVNADSTALRDEIAARRAERNRLATFIAAVKAELEGRRSALSAAGQRDFDLERSLVDARAKLQQLERQRADLAHAQPTSVQVQNLPTPIAKTVHGKEIHLQLRGGRLAIIPLEELLEEFQETARHKVYKLQSQNEVVDTVGPLGGFRLRYTLGRFDLSMDDQMSTGRSGSVVKLVRWDLLPVSSTLGEPIDDALAEQSSLRRLLATLNPSADTITVWTYPDSFSAFRRLKAELHAMRFATAGRPLPIGQPIGGSPEGTRSAAQ
jgi:hypothetical protein